jgi:radical SAM superfamily enzyme
MPLLRYAGTTASVNGLTNIWKFNLKDKSLTQVTFGTGPDVVPMPDPAGKGLYLMNANLQVS